MPRGVVAEWRLGSFRLLVPRASQLEETELADLEMEQEPGEEKVPNRAIVVEEQGTVRSPQRGGNC